MGNGARGCWPAPAPANNHEARHRAFWQAYGPRREERRERDPEKRFHTALVWREIARNLAGVRRVLDAGAGPGRFSLPLARRGLAVAHLEPAPVMLARARRRAVREGLRLEFVAGDVSHLPFAPASFDLVLCLDAPVSYATSPPRALAELSRVTGGTLVVSVVNRWGQLPVGVGLEAWLGRPGLAKSRLFLKEGRWAPPPSWERLGGCFPFLRPFLFPPLYAFTPAELAGELERLGLEVERLVATGSLARLVGRRTLRRLWRDPVRREEFLALSEEFDARPEVLGLGARGASGLLAVARRPGARLG